jgi:hypothetical protein
MPTAAQLPAETQETEPASPPSGCAPAAEAGTAPEPHIEITNAVTADARAPGTRTPDHPATEITTHGFVVA